MIIPLKPLIINALIDLLCWAGLTAWLVSANYTTIAALIGATGLIYMVHIVKTIIRIKRHNMIMQTFNQLKQVLKDHDCL